MKRLSKIWIVIAVVVIAAMASFLLSGNKKKEEVNFVTEAVAPANIVIASRLRAPSSL